MSELIADLVDELLIEKGGRKRSKPTTALSRYIKRRGGAEVVAKELGISVSHLNKLARDKALPSLRTAINVMSATGEMSLSQWKKSKR